MWTIFRVVLLGDCERPRGMRPPRTLADMLGTGQLRTTAMEDLRILNVPGDRRRRGSSRLQWPRVDALPVWRGRDRLKGGRVPQARSPAIDKPEARRPRFEAHLKIHITGCPQQAATSSRITAIGTRQRSWSSTVGLCDVAGLVIRAPSGGACELKSVPGFTPRCIASSNGLGGGPP
jgi:hypothetical protein